MIRAREPPAVPELGQDGHRGDGADPVERAQDPTPRLAAGEDCEVTVQGGELGLDVLQGAQTDGEDPSPRRRELSVVQASPARRAEARHGHDPLVVELSLDALHPFPTLVDEGLTQTGERSGLQDVGRRDPALREPGLKEQRGHVLAVSPVGLGSTLRTSPGADLGRVTQMGRAARPLELLDDEAPAGRCLQGEVCIGSVEAGQPRSQGLAGPGDDAASMDLSRREVLPVVGDLTAVKIECPYDSHWASSSSGWHEDHAWAEGVPLHAIFFTVETAFIQTLYVLFFIEVGTRRVHVMGSTRNPDAAYTTQQARNLFTAEERPTGVRHLIRDHDSKFTRSFDSVFGSEGAKVILTPIRSPKANAYAERWVRTVRNEVLDITLVLGRRHLDRLLSRYASHYNSHRPHRGSGFRPPKPAEPTHRLPHPDRYTGTRSSPASTSTWPPSAVGDDLFLIARNPQEDSKLPYLLRLPIGDGMVLKARDTWPRSVRIYCHRFEGGWPADAQILEEIRVSFVRRRGPVIDLVLDRAQLSRSQFVFTEVKGRPAIFWQTQKAARAANPGARIPRARAIPESMAILIDTRERYPYRFAGRQVETERAALPAGDYGVAGEELIATVERKTLENLVASVSDGTLAFQMQRLGELGRAAVVVEGRYSAIFKLEHVPAAFIADGLARLQVRYPEIQIVFADSG